MHVNAATNGMGPRLLSWTLLFRCSGPAKFCRFNGWRLAVGGWRLAGGWELAVDADGSAGQGLPRECYPLRKVPKYGEP